MRDLVFLDTETTGLDPDRHSVWELAWAVNDGDVHSAFVAHDLESADFMALKVGGYFERLPRPLDLANGAAHEAMLKGNLDGATLVGANPAFDAAFLRVRWGCAPWHYRLLDVESFAMPILGYDRPQGLATIAEDLASLGKYVFEPDHTAASDVHALRDVFGALWELRENVPGDMEAVR